MFSQIQPQFSSWTTQAVRSALSLAVAAGALFSSQLASVEQADAASCQFSHTVQRGQTLYTIGLMYNRTWDGIAAANNITNPNKIFAGQVLCIPWPASGGPTQPAPDVIVVLGTNVQNVLTLTDVNLRVGPGMSYNIMGKVVSGQTVKVTGISSDGNWWRVICPDGSTGNCWITAGASYTKPTGGTGNNPQPAPSVPAIAVSAVVHDQTVTIRATNFPAGYRFTVLMGDYGSMGVNGHAVTTIDSGAGGAFTGTYTIPAALRGSSRIAIRLQSERGGYYSYNWFWNTTTN
jgi:uncharacterized protein YraI